MGVHNKNRQYGFGSVKPRDAEIVKSKLKINKKAVFISLVILGVGLISTGLYSFFKSDLDSKAKNAVAGLFAKEAKEDSVYTPEVDIKVNEGTQNTASVVGAVNSVQNQENKVKIALLASPDLFDYKNHPILGCDALVFAQAEVPKTPKILNATLDLLFNDDFDYGFPPANFIASTQKDLKFDSAVIENGVAKVFLTGLITVDDQKCDKNRIIYQIEETAKQFKTVKTVEIFLNGEKLAI